MCGVCQLTQPDQPPITVAGNFYLTEYQASVAREFEENLRGLFVWLRISDLDAAITVPNAQYAVPFCVFSGVGSERLYAMNLAKILLEFVKVYALGDQVQQFEITSLCYKFREFRVYGVMFLDGGLGAAFSQVRRDALAEAVGTCMIKDNPVTFWPPGRNMWMETRSYDKLLDKTR